MLLEAEPRTGGAADHDHEEQNQQQRVVVRSAANFRLRDFIFEKVVFVLVVALPFPMLGSHPSRKKQKEDTMFWSDREVVLKEGREREREIESAVCVSGGYYFCFGRLLYAQIRPLSMSARQSTERLQQRLV